MDRIFAPILYMKNPNNISKYNSTIGINMGKEYDFSEGIRGKYSKKCKAGTNIVLLEPDVAQVFKMATSVNQALRSLAEIIKAQK
jgi:hypothetical protein